MVRLLDDPHIIDPLFMDSGGILLYLFNFYRGGDSGSFRRRFFLLFFLSSACRQREHHGAQYYCSQSPIHLLYFVPS